MDYKNTIEKENKEKVLYKKTEEKPFEKVKKHTHDGLDADKIKPENLRQSFITIVDSTPTEAPTRYVDNIKLYPDGDNSILYVWDNENEVWRKFNYYEAP
jgi:hypothetical protein